MTYLDSDRVLEKFKGGQTVQEVADDFGVPYHSIRRVLKEAGISTLPAPGGKRKTLGRYERNRSLKHEQN